MQNSKQYDEQWIRKTFQWAASQQTEGYSPLLEELKNRISDERDYNDMIDLLKDLSIDTKSFLYTLFRNNHIPDSSKYKIKVISDVDNTAIENRCVAPVMYVDKELIPGYQALLHVLSADTTTSSFISARPSFIENLSIDTLAEKLDRSLKFNFLNGNLIPIIELMASKVFRDKVGTRRAYTHMANKKFYKFNELFHVYPHCKFIFFGDDTQGDYKFAKLLVESVPESMAFIRVCNGTKIDPKYHSEYIVYHKSYYEVIYTLVCMEIINIESLDFILKDYYEKYDYWSYDQRQVNYDKYFISLLEKQIRESR